MDVVWVYFRKGAESDELEASVRSVVKNLKGYGRLFVCGDDPGPWFRELGGQWINSPRVSRPFLKRVYGIGASDRWIKWCDSIHKLIRICEDDRVSDRFLWMYDDTMILQRTEITELDGAFYKRIRKPREEDADGKSWQECRRRTFLRLQDRGFPCYDFSTHFPVCYDKTKLLLTIVKMNAMVQPTVIESAYLNMWEGGKASRFPRGLFSYRKSPTPKNFCWGYKVVNLGAWTPVRELIWKAIRKR